MAFGAWRVEFEGHKMDYFIACAKLTLTSKKKKKKEPQTEPEAELSLFSLTLNQGNPTVSVIGRHWFPVPIHNRVSSLKFVSHRHIFHIIICPTPNPFVSFSISISPIARHKHSPPLDVYSVITTQCRPRTVTEVP